MFSFLDEIDKYIKKSNIPFRRIKFNYSLLPKYINQVILNDMRAMCNNHFEFGVDTYELIYDNNDHLCLMVSDRYGKNISVYSNNIYGYRPSFDFKVFSRSEKNLIEKACILKYLQNERLQIREIIAKTANNLSTIDKVKLEYQLLEKEVKRIFFDDKAKLNQIINEIDFKSILDECVLKIIDYLEYLNDYNDENIKIIEEKNKMQGIRYTEPEGDTVIRTGNSLGLGSKERVNSIIDAEERFEVLESYPYIYREYAYSSSSKEINYMNYLYKISDNLYVLIMEPHNGTKYTKIAVFSDNQKITKEIFSHYIRYYLELSESECLNTGNIVRSGHTTLDIFKDKLQYVLLGVSNTFGNDYFKNKVRKLKEQ